MPRYCRRHRISLLANLVFGVLLLISLGLLFSDRLHGADGPHGSAAGAEDASSARRGDGAAKRPPDESGGAASDEALLEGADFFLFTHAPEPLVDWHNYSQIKAEKRRRGPGEHGAAVFVKHAEKARADQLYQVNGYNAFVSDKISVRRALRDIRHPSCKAQKYHRRLPTASIIVPFHQEHWSTLLRTFVTALLRAPAHLVKEVILVDDDSSKEFLKTPLERYIASQFKDKVRVIRAAKRQGLIRARILGAENATGDVLIFLDSHCEVNVNWLPPLLDPISQDYRTVVCPLIDIVDYDTFEYRPQDEGARGSFDWEFFYKRLPLLPTDLKYPSRPFESPVMAGGLFAISRKWFWELGGYDPGLDIWGGEQYELSFKIWQCGGRMVDAPCSRIGHVYRKFAPFPNNAKGDFVGRNYRRVAEVWMDEYKEYLYKRRPHYRDIDPGDLTEQRAVRERLQCKPFSWYMERVAFDQPKHYPPVEPPPAAEGSLRWMEDTRFCLDTAFGQRGQSPRLALCVEDSPDGRRGEQTLNLTFRRDVRVAGRGLCLDVPDNRDEAPVVLFPCHGLRGNQWWKFEPHQHQLRHVVTDKCLQADAASRRVMVQGCDTKAAVQKWSWHKTRDNLLEEYLKDAETE